MTKGARKCVAARFSDVSMAHRYGEVSPALSRRAPMETEGKEEPCCQATLPTAEEYEGGLQSILRDLRRTLSTCSS